MEKLCDMSGMSANSGDDSKSWTSLHVGKHPTLMCPPVSQVGGMTTLGSLCVGGGGQWAKVACSALQSHWQVCNLPRFTCGCHCGHVYMVSYVRAWCIFIVYMLQYDMLQVPSLPCPITIPVCECWNCADWDQASLANQHRTLGNWAFTVPEVQRWCHAWFTHCSMTSCASLYKQYVYECIVLQFISSSAWFHYNSGWERGGNAGAETMMLGGETMMLGAGGLSFILSNDISNTIGSHAPCDQFDMCPCADCIWSGTDF